MQRIPTVTKNLLIINVLAFLATEVLGQTAGVDLTSTLGLHFFKAPDFQVYQLVTYMFMHGGFTHILVNMFMLWMFGAVVENMWGAKRYLFYYILCGVGAGLCQELTQYCQYVAKGLADYSLVDIGTATISTEQYLNLWTTVGASGSVYALLLAFGMMFPNEKMFIIPIPFPIKAKWIIFGSIAVEFFLGLSGGGDGVAHMAHLGGMAFGFLLILHWRRQSNGYRSTRSTQFFSNMQQRWNNRQTKRNQSGRSYNDNPDWNYNATKRATQEEIDRILDKIRKSGYDSLTKDEKQTLFDQSKHDR